METKLMTGVVNSANAEIKKGIPVHVQTEIVERISLIVVCVLYKGYCIYRTERDYKACLSKENIAEVLPRVAAAMHQQVLQRLPRIWAELTPAQLQCVSERESLHSERPPEAIDGHDVAVELFEQGLATYRNDPDKALALWRQALELEPTNRACRTNLHRLEARLKTG
jgi:hypothetical protein